MILAVSGMAFLQNEEQQNEYKREFYQPHTRLELKENIEKDFGKMLAEETSKLQIDILI